MWAWISGKSCKSANEHKFTNFEAKDQFGNLGSDFKSKDHQ